MNAKEGGTLQDIASTYLVEIQRQNNNAAASDDNDDDAIGE